MACHRFYNLARSQALASLFRSIPNSGSFPSCRAFCSSVAPRQVNYAERNYANNVDEYNTLLSHLSSSRRSYLLRDVYDDMLLDGVQPLAYTFSTLIAGCMKGSRLQDALFFFEELKTMGFVPDVLVFNCLIAICGKCKQIYRALQIAEEMEAWGIYPKMKTFTTLLSACGAAGQPDDAAGIVRRMTALGLTLNKYCYGALISAYSNQRPLRKGAFDKIFELLRRSRSWSANETYAMQEGSDVMNDTDEELYNLATTDFIQIRRTAVDRRLTVYHAALRACAEHGNTEALRGVLEMLRQDGHHPDQFCIAQILKCHLVCGEIGTALKGFHGYLSSDRIPHLDLFLVFIHGAMQGYTPEGMKAAREALQEMTARGLFLNLRSGSELLEMASNEPGGDFSTANLIFDMMNKSKILPTFRSLQTYFRGLKSRMIPEGDARLDTVKELLNSYRSRASQRNLRPTLSQPASN
eukprot:c27371_g1_i1 orf=624-2024(-)